MRCPIPSLICKVGQASLWSTILHSHGNALDSLRIYRAICWEGTDRTGKVDQKTFSAICKVCCINGPTIDMKIHNQSETAGPRAYPVEYYGIQVRERWSQIRNLLTATMSRRRELKLA